MMAALLALSPMAQAHHVLSDNDRFALYCLGALQTASETLLHLYPGACPTGAEHGCASMRETIVAIEDDRTAARRYLAAQFAERRGHTGRLLLTIRMGAIEQNRCLLWRLEKRGSSPAVGLPAHCQKVAACRDLSGTLGSSRHSTPY